MSAVDADGRYRIGVDTGGTFTDIVAFDERDGTERKVKVPSTPHAPAEAVLAAFDSVAQGAAIEPAAESLPVGAT